MAELINDHPQLEVVGEAESGAAASRLVVEKDADLAVVDVQMPSGGVEAIERIHALRPGLPVLVFTATRGRRMKETMLEAGAVAVVPKGAPVDVSQVIVDLLGGSPQTGSAFHGV